MEVTQTLSEGLKREFKVVLPAQELRSRLDGQIAEMKDKVRINGFRPGKVPLAHLKRLYGRSLMADIVQKAIGEAETKIIGDNSLRFALQPKFDIPTDKEAMESVLDAKSDLAFTVSGEILPHVEVGSLEELTLERLTAPVPEEDVEAALHRFVTQSLTYTAVADPDKTAETDERVTIDFTGRIDGEVFDGGTGSDIALTIGSKAFLPGFEEQLVGAKVGESRTINVAFPADYQVPDLAGKDAVFDVTVKEIATAAKVEVDDEFAKGYGAEDLDGLKAAIRNNFEAEFARASRLKLKRQLLDEMDKRYDFALPQSLVDQEFATMWQQLENEQRQNNQTFADENTTEEEARADYRRIAERRVRVGLVMAAIGEAAAVVVSPEEVRQGLLEVVRRFRGQEKEVWDFYQKDPTLMQQIRAPIYEDKVVDVIVGRANVSSTVVTREELFKPDDDVLPWRKGLRGGAAAQHPAGEQHDAAGPPAAAGEPHDPAAGPPAAAEHHDATAGPPAAAAEHHDPVAEHHDPAAGPPAAAEHHDAAAAQPADSAEPHAAAAPTEVATPAEPPKPGEGHPPGI